VHKLQTRTVINDKYDYMVMLLKFCTDHQREYEPYRMILISAYGLIATKLMMLQDKEEPILDSVFVKRQW
jgi:hypothetical protein